MVSLWYHVFYVMISFTARIKEGMYKQLKTYAEKNGLSVMGAIRFIISQFFIKQTIIDEQSGRL